MIFNPQAVAFSNTRLRHGADLLAQLYFEAKRTVTAWNALQMSALITNTSDVITDGSDTSGRPVITGAQATTIVTRLIEFIADYEASSNAKLTTVLQVAPNP